MRILLLSAYDAMSHKQWRQGIVDRFPGHAWTVLTLPARHFAWRVRGNAMSWLFLQRQLLTQGYDLILATSLVDLATLKGLVPELAATPAVVYFHENQFAYPDNASKHGDVEIKITSIYTALAADRVCFNSAWNRNTFLAGADALLSKMPDALPKGVAGTIAGKAMVLPVPLDETVFDLPAVDRSGTLTIVWNHRWEYDKAPERLFRALCILRERGIDFRLNIIGQQFRTAPAVFAEMKEKFAAHINHWGFIESREEYLNILRASHLAVSTALHDFQGLALMEAIACGCLPVAPDRLAYRDYLPESCRYASMPEDGEAEAFELAAKLAGLASRHAGNTLPELPDISAFSWSGLQPAYETIFHSS